MHYLNIFIAFSITAVTILQAVHADHDSKHHTHEYVKGYQGSHYRHDHHHYRIVRDTSSIPTTIEKPTTGPAGLGSINNMNKENLTPINSDVVKNQSYWYEVEDLDDEAQPDESHDYLYPNDDHQIDQIDRNIEGAPIAVPPVTDTANIEIPNERLQTSPTFWPFTIFDRYYYPSRSYIAVPSSTGGRRRRPGTYRRKGWWPSGSAANNRWSW